MRASLTLSDAYRMADKAFATHTALRLLPEHRRTVAELNRHCRQVLGLFRPRPLLQQWGVA